MSNTNVVRTALGSLLQTCHYVDANLPVLPNSTLNEKLAIFPDSVPADSDKLGVHYIAIGNGGHSFITGGNGRVKWISQHHTARDCALYNQLPFILRTLDNDLTPTDRLKYRLRRLETHFGVVYAAYYLRVLDLNVSEPRLELRHVDGSTTTSEPFTPTLEDLNPVPPVLVTGEAVTTTGDYIAATAKVVFTMTADEIKDFVDAVKIIEGEEGFAVISEIATVSGVDRVVQGQIHGSMQNYTDAIYTQVTSFISSAWVMEYQTDSVSITLDLGNVEPLLSVS